MGARETTTWMSSLARHQWVREHGTPRVSTLTGGEAAAKAWREWLRLSRRAFDRRRMVVQPAVASEGWLGRAAARVTELATDAPREPIALVVAERLLDDWLRSGEDRLRVFLAEGIVRVRADVARPSAPPRRDRALALARARSLAELTLFEALEATPATAGRFRLNEPASFHFGDRAVEVDLLSRQDEVAIEIDGYHHFTDADAYRRDRRKDLLLQAHGYVVLRLLADDVLADPRAAVQSVVELLGIRLGRQKGPRSP